MEFGIFHEFERPAGVAEPQAFDEAFAIVDAAERWGLDAVWLAEIHFSPQRSLLSSPLTIASAIATRTERIKIGTAVQVLPLHHPLRLAEETATIDHLSHGRLIFGVGRSGFANTYKRFEVPYAESRERFAETLDVIRRGWTEDTFSYSGTYYHFDDASVVPKPYQKPHPPIRIAATSADTFPACGELGLPIFCAVRLGTLAELGPNIAAYRAAFTRLEQAGGVSARAGLRGRDGGAGAHGAGREHHRLLSDARSTARGIGRRRLGRGRSRTAPGAASDCRRSAGTRWCATRWWSARPRRSWRGCGRCRRSWDWTASWPS